MTDAAMPMEPWQWPEEHWRKLVDQVRAGKTFRPKSWKGGARCAVALSFDSREPSLALVAKGPKALPRRTPSGTKNTENTTKINRVQFVFVPSVVVL